MLLLVKIQVSRDLIFGNLETVMIIFSVGQRRLRRLVRLDAANHCLRAMKPIFQEQNPSPLQIMAIDALSLALIHVSAKDRKITLKVRLAGLIPHLVKRIEEADRLWTTSTLLKLVCRCCLRSGGDFWFLK